MSARHPNRDGITVATLLTGAAAAGALRRATDPAVASHRLARHMPTWLRRPTRRACRRGAMRLGFVLGSATLASSLGAGVWLAFLAVVVACLVLIVLSGEPTKGGAR